MNRRGKQPRRASLPPFAAFLAQTRLPRRTGKPPCRTCPPFQPGWCWPRCWRSCRAARPRAGQRGRAPLHGAVARRQRRANRRLHGADRFGPLSASQSRHVPPRPRHGAARQGRPRRRDRGYRGGDQARSQLRARLCRPRRRALRPARFDGAIADLEGDPARPGRCRRVHDARQRAATKRATSTAPSPITTRRSACRRIMPPRISIAASPIRRKGDLDAAIADYDRRSNWTRKTPRHFNNRGIAWFARANSTAPSPTTTRRSASTPISPPPTTIAATPGAPRATRRERSPISTAPSSCAAVRARLRQSRPDRLREARLRPRHRRFRRRDPLRPDERGGLQQSRQRLRRQGRPQRRDRRLQRGAAPRSGTMRGSITTAGSPFDATATSTARRRISARRSASTRSTPPRYNERGYAFYQKRDFEHASPTTTRRSSSILNLPSPTTIAATRSTTPATTDRAIADYSEALRIDPDYAAALYNRGIAWRHKGDLDRAIADYDQAIRLNPTAAAYNNRGSAWHAKGENERAIADLDLAISLDPRSADAYINRGNASASGWRFRRRRRRLSHAIALSPTPRSPTTTAPGRTISPGDNVDALADADRAIALNAAPPARSRPAASSANGSAIPPTPPPTSARRSKSTRAFQQPADGLQRLKSASGAAR